MSKGAIAVLHPSRTWSWGYSGTVHGTRLTCSSAADASSRYGNCEPGYLYKYQTLDGQMTGLFSNPSTTTHSFPSHNRHLLHSKNPYSPKMPMFALPGILGGLGLAIRITGELYECFVVNGSCRMADLPTDNSYKVEDLAAFVIPALNETVMMRAESEGLLAAAANTGPCGVPQYNFDMCSADVRRVTVRTSLPAAGGTYPTLVFFCRLSAMYLGCLGSQSPASTTSRPPAWSSRPSSVAAAALRPLTRSSAARPACSTLVSAAAS